MTQWSRVKTDFSVFVILMSADWKSKRWKTLHLQGLSPAPEKVSGHFSCAFCLLNTRMLYLQLVSFHCCRYALWCCVAVCCCHLKHLHVNTFDTVGLSFASLVLMFCDVSVFITATSPGWKVISDWRWLTCPKTTIQRTIRLNRTRVWM